MYKYLAIFLAGLLLVAGGAYGFERWQHGKTRKDLNNKLAEVQEMQKETETAYSRLAVELEDIKTSKGDLQNIIDDRDEKVLALTQANIRLKDKIVIIEHATQTTVDSEGETVVVKEGECRDDVRHRVDFEKTEDPMKITGHTLTNPPFAEVRLDWTRSLLLEVVLTKNDDGTFRAYLDSDGQDIIPADLKLQIDPGVLEYSWYQKIGFGTSVVFGETGVLFSLSAFYDVLPNLYVGPMIQMGYVGNNAELFFGGTLGWYPWK